MATAEQAVVDIWEALAAHFRRSADPLTPEQVVEMTAYDQDAVSNALAVLYNNGHIKGATVLGTYHPVLVTGVNYRY